MAKRDKKTITLGSGHVYIMDYADVMPDVTDICKEENRLGYIKGGAALEYSQETYEEKDDLGLVSKIITTTEEALLKMGLLTWNGETLTKLIDRCKTEVKDGKRITYIGGAGNAQGGYYVVCFHQVDKVNGDLWVLIMGRNTAGATLTFNPEEGTVVEPEFKALPHDDNGTLIKLVEETGAAA